jgi:hypothetical protein
MLPSEFDFGLVKVRPNKIEFLIFFQIFMIWFGRIELATDPNKPLDSMDLSALFLTRVRLGQPES